MSIEIRSDLVGLERTLRSSSVSGQQQQTTEAPDAPAVLSVRGDLPMQPIDLNESSLRRIDVKFFFTNKKYVPSGIPEREYEQGIAVGEHSARYAYAIGRTELAQYERLRKGAYDTGEAVIKDLARVQVATLRRGFTNIGMLLTGCYWQEQQKTGQPRKWVVVLRFGWEQVTTEYQRRAAEVVAEAARAAKTEEVAVEKLRTEQSMDSWLRAKQAYDRAVSADRAAREAVLCLQQQYKPSSLVLNDSATEMVRALARTTWGHCWVYKNPDRSVTVNMLHRSPDAKPDFALAVRERRLAVLDVRESVNENEE